MGEEHLISLQPGTIIAGRYEVVKCLGAGSMGLVYACRHRELGGHLVAVKVLFPEVAQDKVAAARFRNEIFASYGVSHSNVVRAYEYLRDGDLVAYTMEYVGGGDLATRLSKPGKLMPIDDIVKILTQMCSGVQAIHDAGIVHRDLKPENILLSNEGHVKIADFGIARTGHGPKLTEHGGVVGTIDYVSPEYILNSQVDWRSDIYALGILGYEMITGVSPFRGDSVYATMTKRLKTDATPPVEIRPECPIELNRIILRAMARDPEQRYQSAAAMFYDLMAMQGDAQQNSGAFFPLSQRSAGIYVGPAVRDAETGSGAHRIPSRGGAAVGGLSMGVEDTVETAAPVAASMPRGASAVDSALSGTPVMARRAQRVAGFNDDLEDDFDASDTIHEPAKMESVLERGQIERDPRRRSSSITLAGGGIDDARIRKLSQVVDRMNRSIWVDVVTLVLIVLVGVGVGFTLLRLFLPDTVTRSAPERRKFDAQTLEELYE